MTRKKRDKISADLEPAQRKWLRREAARIDISVSELLRRLIAEVMAK